MPQNTAWQPPQVGQNLYNKGSSANSNSGGTTQYPAQIKCYVCKRDKPQSHYSKRQLTTWRSTIYQPYAPAGRVLKDPRTTCTSCTAKQTTELTCCVCGETKGLDRFAKNQRSNPDGARCIGCVNFHADAEPDLELPEEEDYDSGLDDDEDVDFDTNEPLSKYRKERGPVAPVEPTLARQSKASSRQGNDENWDAVSRASTVQSDVTQIGISTGASEWSYAPSNSAPSVTSSQYTKTNKGGWAKVDKLKKPNINAMAGAEGATEPSEWMTVRDKPKPGQHVIDPWDLIYK